MGVALTVKVIYGNILEINMLKPFGLEIVSELLL